MDTTVYFIILSAITLSGGLLTITRRHPLSATLCLVMTLIALAGLYALLSSDFLFVIQILVYAGAIMALMVFVIMLLNVKESHFPPEKNITLRVITALIFLAPFYFLVQRTLYMQFAQAVFPHVTHDYGSIQAVGQSLYQQHFFPFEIISILLLVALVGVVALAKRRA